jgi:hypothetical protein
VRAAGLRAPAGLLVGPALWVASTQAGQILPYLSCGASWPPLAFVAFPGALGSLLAAVLSWRASASAPAARAFLGRVSALSGLVFAYALGLQGLSALMLSACER